MRREDLIEAQVAGKEVYYDRQWWFVGYVTSPEIEKSKAYLVQVDKPTGVTDISELVDTDLIYSNSCELCDLPADGLNQYHCQEHWEQECEEAFMKQIQEMYSGVEVEE